MSQNLKNTITSSDLHCDFWRSQSFNSITPRYRQVSCNRLIISCNRFITLQPVYYITTGSSSYFSSFFIALPLQHICFQTKYNKRNIPPYLHKVLMPQLTSCRWSLSIPPKNIKNPWCFLMFSEGIERYQWHKMS